MSAAEALAGVDPQLFKACMRSVTGAVVVITCGEEGRRTGLTATAVCSLTDAPPMLLVCVNANASAHPVIRHTGRFVVNVLNDSHGHLASRFAGRAGLEGEARFAGVEWTRLATGAPVLAEAAASFDCTLEAEHHYGTHSIFIGRVLGAASRDDGTPLLYRGGRFGTFTEPLALQ